MEAKEKRRILFIGPRFYDYHVRIKEAFEKQNCVVDYFDDRPGEGFFTKALVRLNKNLINGKIKRYFSKIKEKAEKEKYDFVFVLYGQSFSKKMMEELRDVLPHARFVFYMYDPIQSMPDRAEFSKVFDKCYSFDSEDVRHYSNFKSLPLFYSVKAIPDSPILYDACFVGTMMPGKYRIVHQLISELKQNGMNVFDFEYLQSRLVGLYYILTKKEFRKAKLSEFSYKRMSTKDAYGIFASSKYIIDCPKEGQSGLTIRIFEALSAEKKIITTNSEIKNYDFYNPQNIYVYDGNKIDFSCDFFRKDYQPLDASLIEKYSIDSWVKEILS